MSESTTATLGQQFWTASQTQPPAVPKAQSSCCGPKPEATTAAETETATAAEPKAKSSCCGPKPEATTAEGAAPVAKKSCCG